MYTASISGSSTKSADTFGGVSHEHRETARKIQYDDSGTPTLIGSWAGERPRNLVFLGKRFTATFASTGYSSYDDVGMGLRGGYQRLGSNASSA